jgi:hypothetical protein
MRYAVTRVVVNTSPMFVPGGSINSWTRRVAFETQNAAKVRAPHQTGLLTASIDADVDATPLLRVINVRVGSDAPYAKYVHEGTANNGAGYIYTTKGYANRALVDSWIARDVFPPNPRGYYMPVSRRGGPTHYALRVHGQRANPFLVNGYNDVARVHRALPRMR